MRTFITVIWVLIVIGFFLLWLWNALEERSNKERKARASKDIFNQLIFVTACVALTIFIDRMILEEYLMPLIPEFVPVAFMQVILLPIVLYFGALLTGGSKSIFISKAPKPSQNRKRR